MSEFLSVIVPVHNEAAVLPRFHARMSQVMSETGYAYEIVYIDDGSDDDSAARIAGIRDEDSSVALIELSRNFGKEIALSAGLDHARGDAVIVIDADLQDPPELMGDFVAEWRNGYDVVYGRRLSRSGESWLKIYSA